uniref:Uncharacterized protein n=1 Tax=Ditylenchus dipsaci TaxID=166011 RepID=A0A915DVK8_9BILA
MENHYQEYHHHQHAYHQPHLSGGNGRPSMPKKQGNCLAESSCNFLVGCEPYSNGKSSRQLISEQLESHLANHYQQPGPPPPSNRRFSFIGLDDLAQIEAMDKYSTGQEKHRNMCSSLMVGSQQKLSSHNSNCSSPIADGKATLSKKAQKIAQKAQKLSISSISSELSSSASALYSLFTDNQSANSISVGHCMRQGVMEAVIT